jgi:hypothetical protein
MRPGRKEVELHRPRERTPRVPLGQSGRGFTNAVGRQGVTLLENRSLLAAPPSSSKNRPGISSRVVTGVVTQRVDPLNSRRFTASVEEE